ncbi:MAG: hypothetical protein SAJ37_10425 [Oscillatoria sp. PMC 1068.18]|nr:hypothetical protein [Oscillatoria sp. PMC 1068.18]
MKQNFQKVICFDLLNTQNKFELNSKKKLKQIIRRIKMLSPEDQANFKEVGKQASDISFPPRYLTEALRYSVYQQSSYDFYDTVQMICLNDDGQIDEAEGKLIAWSRNMSLNLTEEDIWEAEDLMHEGFYAG